MCYKSSNYNEKAGVWKDSSGNHNNAISHFVHMAAAVPRLIPHATPNGSPAVQGRLNSPQNVADFGVWLMFKPVNLSSPSGFTVVAYMIQRTFDNNIHREFLSGDMGSLSLRPNMSHMAICTAWTADIGNNNSKFKPHTWAIFAVHGVMGKTATFRFDGHNDGTFKMPTYAAWTRTYQFFHCTGSEIAELRVYNKDLTTKQIQAIEARMTARYGAPGPVPAEKK